MNAPLRRGACPGLSAPMPTGDGLLVRFSPAEPMTPVVFAGLCEAARRHGNGTMEITARGNLQVRGLTARSAPEFARAFATLGLEAGEGITITADPLPCERSVLADTSALARDLRNALARAAFLLGPKVSIVLDGGGCLHLDAVAADLRLRALALPQGIGFHVAVAGDARSATPLGVSPADEAVDIVLRLLGVIASHGRQARAADILEARGIAPFRTAAERLKPAPALPERAPAQAIATHPLRDGSVALGIALPFGHAHADDLIALTQIAAARGARALQLAPARALLLLGLAQSETRPLIHVIQDRGFITRPDDPRRRIIACPGKPACASGWIAARVLARQLAPFVPPSGEIVHISGCAKGCAHPGAAALTVVGSENGCGVVRHGSARAVPEFHVEPGQLAAEIAHLANGDAR